MNSTKGAGSEKDRRTEVSTIVAALPFLEKEDEEEEEEAEN